MFHKICYIYESVFYTNFFFISLSLDLENEGILFSLKPNLELFLFTSLRNVQSIYPLHILTIQLNEAVYKFRNKFNLQIKIRLQCVTKVHARRR